jgi:NAD(P)H-nitrite reductase large subunit
MNDPYRYDKSDVICSCSGTTETQIKRLIEKGCADLERISRTTGACSGCGACEPDILALLAEYAALNTH